MQRRTKYAGLRAKVVAVEKGKKDSSCKSSPEWLYKRVGNTPPLEEKQM